MSTPVNLDLPPNVSLGEQTVPLQSVSTGIQREKPVEIAQQVLNEQQLELREIVAKVGEGNNLFGRVQTVKSYWNKGILSAIYYSFYYWIYLKESQRIVLDAIYSAVEKAARCKTPLLMDTVAATLPLVAKFEKEALLELIDFHYEILDHALGYEKRVEAFLVCLHLAHDTPHSKEYLKRVVRYLGGDEYILKIAAELLTASNPETVKVTPFFPHVIFEKFMSVVREHAFYAYLKEKSVGQNLDAEIAAFAIERMKEVQLIRLISLSDAAMIIETEEQIRKELQARHKHLDALARLYRNPSVLAFLFECYKKSATLGLEDFATLLPFAREQYGQLQQAVSEAFFYDLLLAMGDDFASRLYSLKILLGLPKELCNLGIELLAFLNMQELEEKAKQELLDYLQGLEEKVQGFSLELPRGISARHVVASLCTTCASVFYSFLDKETIQYFNHTIILYVAQVFSSGLNREWSAQQIEAMRDELAGFGGREELLKDLQTNRQEYVGIFGEKNLEALILKTVEQPRVSDRI